MEEKRQKDPAAVAMAKKRAAKLSPKRRKEIATQAVTTRWENEAKRKAAAKKKAE